MHRSHRAGLWHRDAAEAPRPAGPGTTPGLSPLSHCVHADGTPGSEGLWVPEACGGQTARCVRDAEISELKRLTAETKC